MAVGMHAVRWTAALPFLPISHPALPSRSRHPPPLLPVELLIVFVLVGLKLGFLASLAGVSTLLALIPVQVGCSMEARCTRCCFGRLSCQPTQAATLPPPSTHTFLPSRLLQALLVRRIGRLRAGTAAQTDERVRLTGEIIGGVLATKMLGERGQAWRLSVLAGACACFRVQMLWGRLVCCAVLV